MLKRRFIAGAICPQCAELDKIVMYDDEQQRRWRECVSCGFRDIQSHSKDEPREITTRVNQPRPGQPSLAHEDQVDIVKVVDAGSDEQKQQRNPGKKTLH